jgi:alpha-1,6-mannosyltransferase
MAILPSVRDSVSRLTAVGFVSTLLIALASNTRGWPFPSLTSEPWIYQLNATNPFLRYSLLAVFFIGVAGLCWSWVRLLAISRERDLQLRLLVKAGVLWSLPLLVAVPLFSGDVYVYFVDGEALARGYDPYESGVSSMGPAEIIHMVHPLWRTTTTMYGPVFLSMAEGVANLTGGRLIPGVFIFKLIAAASVALMAWATVSLARHFNRSVGQAFIFAILNPLTMLHLVGGAHNDATMLALLMAGMAIGLRSKSWPVRVFAIFLCMVGASFKIPAFAGALVLGWLWAGDGASYARRVIYSSLAAIVGLAMFHALAVVTGAGWGWLRATDVPGLAHPLFSPPNAVAMAFGGPFGAGDALNTYTRAIATFVSVVAAIVLIFRTGTRSTQHQVMQAFGWAMLIIGWLGPAVYPWYLTWGVALVGLAGAGRLHKPLVIVVVVASFVIAPGGYGFLDLWADWRRTVMAFLVMGAFGWSLWKIRPGGHFKDPVTTST